MPELIKTDDKLNELEKSMNEALEAIGGAEKEVDEIDTLFKARKKEMVEEIDEEDEEYEDDDDDDDDDYEKSRIEELDGFQKSILIALNDKFKDFEKSYGKEIKALRNENETLKKSLSTFLKSQRDYTQELRKSVDEIGNQPLFRKSVMAVADRVFSTNENGNEVTLTKSQAMNKLADVAKSLTFEQVSKLEDKLNKGLELSKEEAALLLGGK